MNQTKVYRKPTQTNLYSHWNSFCDKKTKIGVVKTLVRRAVSLCSTENFKKEEFELLENVFVANGYPREIVSKEIKDTEKKILEEEHLKILNPEAFRQIKEQKQSEFREKINVTIPFVGEKKVGKLRRIAKKFGVNISFEKTSTIQQRLIHLKEKVEKDNKKDVVYSIPLSCGKIYIGETGQLWKERENQHKEAVSKCDENKSAIVEHFAVCEERCQKGPPNVLWKDSKILAREKNPGERRARESLEIKIQEKKCGTVNRNSGQPELNSIWEKAVKKFIPWF